MNAKTKLITLPLANPALREDVLVFLKRKTRVLNFLNNDLAKAYEAKHAPPQTALLLN